MGSTYFLVLAKDLYFDGIRSHLGHVPKKDEVNFSEESLEGMTELDTEVI